jgi:NADH-quinone oxidoreductase subunit H
MKKALTVILAIGVILGTIFLLSAVAYAVGGWLEKEHVVPLGGWRVFGPGWSALSNILILVLGFVMIIATFLTLAERKWSAMMQDRIGPNRATIDVPLLRRRPLGGVFHIATDALKMLFKEDFRPKNADPLLFNLGPILAFAPVLALFAVVPVGPVVNVDGSRVGLQVANPDFGLLWVFAIASLAVYGTSLAGWASNNKFALLGGVRASSQMISYEVALGLGLVGAMMAFSSVRLPELIAGQTTHLWGGALDLGSTGPLDVGIPAWGLFLQPIGFVAFFSAAVAETKRAPFDVPEGEPEIIGYFVEYSGMKFGMFMISEFVEIVVLSALITTAIFLGGGTSASAAMRGSPGTSPARPSCSGPSTPPSSGSRFFSSATCSSPSAGPSRGSGTIRSRPWAGRSSSPRRWRTSSSPARSSCSTRRSGRWPSSVSWRSASCSPSPGGATRRSGTGATTPTSPRTRTGTRPQRSPGPQPPRTTESARTLEWPTRRARTRLPTCVSGSTSRSCSADWPSPPGTSCGTSSTPGTPTPRSRTGRAETSSPRSATRRRRHLPARIPRPAPTGSARGRQARCVACYMCATICPAQCIYIEAGEYEATDLATEDRVIEKYPPSSSSTSSAASSVACAWTHAPRTRSGWTPDCTRLRVQPLGLRLGHPQAAPGPTGQPPSDPWNKRTSSAPPSHQHTEAHTPIGEGLVPLKLPSGEHHKRTEVTDQPIPVTRFLKY